MKLKIWYEKLYDKIFSIKFFANFLKIPGVKKLLEYEVISYLVFGVLTTVVSFLSFGIANKIAGADYETKILFTLGTFDFKWLYLSNAISWVCAVTFAYITNRSFVFENKAHTAGGIVKEVLSFFAARIISFLLFEELLFAVLLIPLKHVSGGSWITKIIISVLVVIFNYIAGKLVIFRKRNN